VNVTDFQSFEEIKRQVETIHQEKGLEKPNRYDLNPPPLDQGRWGDYLRQKGYSISKAIFFSAATGQYDLPSDFSLKIPSTDEYLDWFCRLVQSRGSYDEVWFQKIKPLQLNFSHVFKPCWLLKGKNLIGWVYCANLGNYARLFEVEIQPEYQGRGMGKLLLQAIRGEVCKMGVEFILLQSGEGLRIFYEKAGFQECTKNSIIWLKE
jgi:GNAT superfamily N-acetyltransferase